MNDEDQRRTAKQSKKFLFGLIDVDDALERLRATDLPFLVDWILSWTIVVLFSIRYCWQYAAMILAMKLKSQEELIWSLPLVVLPNCDERKNASQTDSIQQFLDLLEETIGKSLNGGYSEDQLVQAMRNTFQLRYLASLIMIPPETSKPDNDAPLKNDDSALELMQKLRSVWHRVLPFSDLSPGSSRDCPFEISVIIPAYRESQEDIIFTIKTAFQTCTRPKEVEIVLVMAAGGDDDDSKATTIQQSLQSEDWMEMWGGCKVLECPAAISGRGPTLNFGARSATGRILTFLHSDTLLPVKWNLNIVDSFRPPEPTSDGSVSIPHACTFTMGVDLSPRGLKGGKIPPGLFGAYAVLGYLRIHLCLLPYGDNVLSFPAEIFHYLGGYPNQPLMEDYEIMHMLRWRSLALRQINSSSSDKDLPQEHLVIMKDRAQCSPRRWQALGVAYTSLVNALCVHRYHNGMTAQDLFACYYRKSKTGYSHSGADSNCSDKKNL